MALRANPTLLGRLTGAKPAEIRAATPTAATASALPAADELLARLADALGIEGAGRGTAEAAEAEGAVLVEHP